MLNKAILIGRLTKDPEMRYTPSGVAVTQFTLAVDRPFTSQGGEKETDFIPIVTWKQVAESVANYMKKGRLVAVDGRIQVRNYENSEGKRVYVTEVIAENVRFLDRERESSGGGNSYSGGGNSGGSGYGGSANRGGAAGGGQQDPFSDDGRPIDISEDDLPF